MNNKNVCICKYMKQRLSDKEDRQTTEIMEVTDSGKRQEEVIIITKNRKK